MYLLVAPHRESKYQYIPPSSEAVSTVRAASLRFEYHAPDLLQSLQNLSQAPCLPLLHT